MSVVHSSALQNLQSASCPPSGWRRKIYGLDGTLQAATGRFQMASRKVDKLATNVDDALEIVDELKYDPDDSDKLDELHETLVDAQDTIDGVDEEEDEDEKEEEEE